MEVEKNMEHEIETGLIWGFIVKDISLFMHPSCCRYSAQWMRHGVAVCSPFPDQASAHQSKRRWCWLCVGL